MLNYPSLRRLPFTTNILPSERVPFS